MLLLTSFLSCFFFNDTATTEIYTLSLHDALPISSQHSRRGRGRACRTNRRRGFSRRRDRSEEHTSELQSQSNLVCRLLLEKKKNNSRASHSLLRTTDLFSISLVLSYSSLL